MLIISEMLENPRRKTERGFSGKTLWDSELAASGRCPVRVGHDGRKESRPGRYIRADR